ncbi:hypothetical protein AALP_AAs47289U000500 [Arabis alpina]|uniref:Uncharacterized protein n=1 Tax=Arabis alpina TaxID=50452 RepID=A0A087G243_ARAAL|nr:hypothetical protein AALP_AAs47289U000500 [Arabis alpina]
MVVSTDGFIYIEAILSFSDGGSSVRCGDRVGSIRFYEFHMYLFSDLVMSFPQP